MSCCFNLQFYILPQTFQTTWPIQLAINSTNSNSFCIINNANHLTPCRATQSIQWGTGVKTNAKGGADAQLGEKQWMWRHLRPERATTSFQMCHSQCMTFPIALLTSPSSPSISATYRISSSGSHCRGYFFSNSGWTFDIYIEFTCQTGHCQITLVQKLTESLNLH
jgi:hypothetical protein